MVAVGLSVDIAAFVCVPHEHAYAAVAQRVAITGGPWPQGRVAKVAARNPRHLAGLLEVIMKSEQYRELCRFFLSEKFGIPAAEITCSCSR